MKIRIPEHLKEINITQFQSWDKVEQGSYFAQQKAVEIFCKVPLPTVTKMKHKDVEEIYNHITAMLSKEPRGMDRLFTFKGQEFGFIPNFSDMSSGEYVDLSTYLGDVQTLHKAMAVLYRPVTLKLDGKYLIEDYEGSDKYSYIMRSLVCEHAFGAVFFFLNTLTILKNDLAVYLKRMSMTDPTLREALEKDTDGMQHFLRSLDMIRQDWMPWLSSLLKV